MEGWLWGFSGAGRKGGRRDRVRRLRQGSSRGEPGKLPGQPGSPDPEFSIGIETTSLEAKWKEGYRETQENPVGMDS